LISAMEVTWPACKRFNLTQSLQVLIVDIPALKGILGQTSNPMSRKPRVPASFEGNWVTWEFWFTSSWYCPTLIMRWQKD
jgi:hypothetical protein